MTAYRISWEIDIDADSAAGAIRLATEVFHDQSRNPRAFAPVFRAQRVELASGQVVKIGSPEVFRGEADFLSAEVFDGEVSVVDARGGRWWPDQTARQQILDAEDEEAEAVRICNEEPMRGQWHD